MLTGCITSESNSGGNKEIIISTEIEDVNNDTEEMFIDNSQGTDIGSFYIGPQEIGEAYIYSGEEVHIPFRLEGLSENPADFGLLLFVDGYPQPYKILNEQEEITGEATMHKFILMKEDVQLFDIVFTPTAGQAGETVGVVYSAIFNPDFIPESEERPNYGLYHSITATMPQELYFETDVIEDDEKAFTEFIEEDIPDDISMKYAGYGTDSSWLDSTPKLFLFSDDDDSNDLNNSIFCSENGKIELKFRILGGVNGITYQTNIYINHEPVNIMGFDCFEITVEKGKMYTASFELDISEYDHLNTIYAISNPIGTDYLSALDFPVKSKSRLLVVEGE
jgi:hypothetical protein